MTRRVTVSLLAKIDPDRAVAGRVVVRQGLGKASQCTANREQQQYAEQTPTDDLAKRSVRTMPKTAQPVEREHE